MKLLCYLISLFLPDAEPLHIGAAFMLVYFYVIHFFKTQLSPV